MSLKLYPPGTRKGNKHYSIYGWWNGKPFERSLGTGDPVEAETRFLEEQVRLRRQKAVGGEITYAEADAAYRAARKLDPENDDAKTLDAIKRELGPRIAAEITGADLQRAARKLKPRVKEATLNREVIVPAAAVLHALAEEGKIPWQRYKRFKETKPEPKPVTETVAKVLAANTTGYKHLLILVLFDHGWRISEALGITWDHIDLGAGTLMHHNGKENDWSRIPLHPEVLAALAVIPEAERKGPLFPWGTKSGVYKWLRPLTRKLGVRFTPHMARHSFATWLVDRGEDDHGLLATQNWRDPKSVKRYTKTNPNRIKMTLGKLKGIS